MLCWQQSLLNYTGDDEYSQARMQVLVALCSKPMQVEHKTVKTKNISLHKLKLF